MKILIESWREFLDEAKEEDIQKKYGFDGGVGEDGKEYEHFAYNQLITWVSQDRPKRIKLLDWMAKQVAGTAWNDTVAMQKVFKIISLAEKFLQFMNQFKKKDINQYKTPEDLAKAYVSDILEPRKAKARKERDKYTGPAKDEGSIVLENDRFFIVRPHSYDASCYYGKKTKWCIAQMDNDYFQQYTQQGRVFYFIKDDYRRDDDQFAKMAIEAEGTKLVQFWDRHDANHDMSDNPDTIKPTIWNAIITTVKKHLAANPGPITPFMELEELAEEIYDGRYDEDGVTFVTDGPEQDDYHDEHYLPFRASVSFEVSLDWMEDFDEEAIEYAVDEEMDAFIEEIDENAYDLGLEYWPEDSWGPISWNNDAMTLVFEFDPQHPEINGGFNRDDVVNRINDIRRAYDVNSITDVEERIIEASKEFFANYLKPPGKEKIEELGKKIEEINSGLKNMMLEYDESDEEIYIGPKNGPIEIDLEIKKVDRRSRALEINRGLKRIGEEIGEIFRVAAAQLQQGMIAQKNRQVKLPFGDEFKAKPEEPFTPENFDFDIGVPKRSLYLDDDKPEMRMLPGAVLGISMEPEDIDKMVEYARFIDDYYEELIRKAMPRVKKLQGKVDALYNNLSEGKIRVRILGRKK